MSNSRAEEIARHCAYIPNASFIAQRQKPQTRIVALHSDDGAFLKTFAMLIQYLNNIFTDISGSHIIQPELNNTGKSGAGLEKELIKVEVLSQHHRFILQGPAEDFGVRSVRRPYFSPMSGRVAATAKIFHPGNRKTVVDDNDHAGCSSISRSLVSHAA